MFLVGMGSSSKPTPAFRFPCGAGVNGMEEVGLSRRVRVRTLTLSRICAGDAEPESAVTSVISTRHRFKLPSIFTLAKMPETLKTLGPFGSWTGLCAEPLGIVPRSLDSRWGDV